MNETVMVEIRAAEGGDDATMIRVTVARVALGRTLEFLAKIDMRGPDECWLWKEGLHNEGYGQFHDLDRSRPVGAHRVAWAVFKNQEPGDLHVLHTCDTRACVNPKHLFLGTNADNQADKTAKGRQARGERVGNAKLCENDVRQMRALAAEGWSQRRLGRRFNVHWTAVGQVLRGEHWSHVS